MRFRTELKNIRTFASKLVLIHTFLGLSIILSCFSGARFANPDHRAYSCTWLS